MRQRLLTGMCVMTMGLVLGVLWNVQDTQAIATSTPTPVDSADLRVFPNDLTCDRREDTLSNQGPSWLGITMGQSTLEDVEELISTFDDEYVFVDDGNYDTRFVISTIIQDEPRFPSSVRLCLERNVVQVIAIGYYNGLLAPRPSLSDFVAQFGVPDAITWTNNPASRVAFWFEQGIATVVTVIPNTPGYPQLEPTFGRVEVEIYFPYQNVEGYEDRWPYNQTRKFNEFLVHPEEADFGPENPFDFEEMIATITAQPSLTPTQTLTQRPATPTATPRP